jgi:predicted RNA-binding protein with PUA-like domain
MNYFLAKTDPETYSIDDFEREKRTAWDGVTNAQAVRAIREMRPGDRVFIYHSGGASSVVGMSVVKSEPRDDPKNPKSAVVDLEFAETPRTSRDAGGNQAVREIRRLGTGTAGAALDYGGAGEVRGLDARAVSQGQYLRTVAMD